MTVEKQVRVVREYLQKNRGLTTRLTTRLLVATALLAATGCSGSRSDTSSEGSAAIVSTAQPASVPTTEHSSEDAHVRETEASGTESVLESTQQLGSDAVDYELDVACLGRDAAFAPYGSALSMHCDEQYLYVETDNLADHEMMAGITAWNGQVPLPHLFFDSNSWAIPLSPTFNESVTETPGLGPIAVAINGVMIFNPTQQSGIYSDQTDPNLIGELDHCGGHSGRGDDYHYHVSPLCLEAEQVAFDQEFGGIVAYALDGYAIYARSEIPDGADLDECGGLGSSADDYRYFASAEFPYVNGCFRGDFDMSLQPHAPGIRDIENGSPKQVEITALYVDEDGTSHMEYESSGVTSSVNYTEVDSGCFLFEFIDDIETGSIRRAETYCRS